MFKGRLSRRIAEAAYALAVTFSIGRWAVQAAYLERGYWAIGGEYIFIPMVAWVAVKVINLFFDALEESNRESRDNEETGSGGIAGMQDNG